MTDSSFSQKIILGSSVSQKSPTRHKRKRGSILSTKSSKLHVFLKRSKQLKRFSGYSHRNFGPYLSANIVSCAENSHFEPASIEATRRLVKRFLGKRSQNLFIVNVVPSIVFSSKPKAVRMGKGKGMPKIKRAHSRKGKIIFKLSTSHTWYGRIILKILRKRLPIKINICSFTQPGLIIRV